MRRKGKTYAFKSTVGVRHAGGTLFGSELEIDRLRTYILLDPRETGADFQYPDLAHLIVGCSANSKHFHNLTKETRTTMFYLGLPSAKELEIMTPKLKPDLDRKVLLSRINDVGPVPRYVFCDEAFFQDRKSEIESTGGGIDDELVVPALTNGRVLTSTATIYGLFSLTLTWRP